MLYFAPELVKVELLSDDGIGDDVPRYQRYPVSKTLIPKTGALYTSMTSTAEKGKLITDDVIKNFLRFLKKEFNL